MSDDERLEGVLGLLRDVDEPPHGCADHSVALARLCTSASVAAGDWEALEAAVDCAACAAVLEEHPYLDPADMDLPLPPPRLSTAAPRRLRAGLVALAVAAGLLLWLWPTSSIAPRPGPVVAGHDAYGWAAITHGPVRAGEASYAYAPTPGGARRVRGSALAVGRDPGEYLYLGGYPRPDSEPG